MLDIVNNLEVINLKTSNEIIKCIKDVTNITEEENNFLITDSQGKIYSLSKMSYFNKEKTIWKYMERYNRYILQQNDILKDNTIFINCNNISFQDNGYVSVNIRDISLIFGESNRFFRFNKKFKDT